MAGKGGHRPGAGRKPGSVGKRTLDIEQKLAALKCDPITGMARIAMDETNTPEIRLRAYGELAQYVAPKRRAIDHSGNVNLVEQILLELGE